MRFYNIKDKRTNKSYRGISPSMDLNCQPFDYFRLGHAYNSANAFQETLRLKCPISFPDKLVRDFILKMTDEMIAEILKRSSPNPAIHLLLTEDTLSFKDQKKILKDIVLTPADILWLNKEAQDLGYLLDIYHEEKYPDKFNDKKLPLIFHKNEDGTIEKLGTTNMTDGELRALLEQRKVVQARIYHKSSFWHCFYFTFKGLSGEESGLMGSKPHYHYLSDKSGIEWDELIIQIKTCDMPTSKVHILIER